MQCLSAKSSNADHASLSLSVKRSCELSVMWTTPQNGRCVSLRRETRTNSEPPKTRKVAAEAQPIKVGAGLIA